jgi:hypothetical protein
MQKEIYIPNDCETDWWDKNTLKERGEIFNKLGKWVSIKATVEIFEDDNMHQEIERELQQEIVILNKTNILQKNEIQTLRDEANQEIEIIRDTAKEQTKKVRDEAHQEIQVARDQAKQETTKMREKYKEEIDIVNTNIKNTVEQKVKFEKELLRQQIVHLTKQGSINEQHLNDRINDKDTRSKQIEEENKQMKNDNKELEEKIKQLENINNQKNERKSTSEIGKIGEKRIKNILEELIGEEWNITNTSGIKESCDIWLENKLEDIQIMVEHKECKGQIRTKEIDKFHRDIEKHKPTAAIIISSDSEFTGDNYNKNPFQMIYLGGIWRFYINNANTKIENYTFNTLILGVLKCIETVNTIHESTMIKINNQNLIKVINDKCVDYVSTNSKMIKKITNNMINNIKTQMDDLTKFHTDKFEKDIKENMNKLRVDAQSPEYTNINDTDSAEIIDNNSSINDIASTEIIDNNSDTLSNNSSINDTASTEIIDNNSSINNTESNEEGNKFMNKFIKKDHNGIINLDILYKHINSKGGYRCTKNEVKEFMKTYDGFLKQERKPNMILQFNNCHNLNKNKSISNSLQGYSLI